MFQKAKLYSLLLVIVASTVVGLFGLTQSASAQQRGEPTIPADAVARWAGETATDSGGRTLQIWSGDQAISEVCNNGNQFLPADGTDIEDVAPDLTDKAAVFYCGAVSPVGLTRVLYVEDAAELEKDNPAVVYVEYDAGEVVEGSSLSLGSQGTPNPDAIPTPTENGEGSEPTPQTCQIKGIGWLICPVVNFLAEITDQSYNLLNRYLLKLEPIALPGAAEGERMQLYDSWKMMRDFANIVFIIGFLLIVFSQITSFGVTNYGIKRLLPKIIIAAILVNISYFLCAVAVDLSNILGNSLRDLLMPSSEPLQFNFQQDAEEPYKASGFVGISDIVLGAVLTGAVVYTFLPVFLPLVVSAAMAVITAIIVLTLRQALVVILIVISPLAFVALLLPNTESYFQKWRSLFMAMLLVYPIISVVFGASALASSILMTASNDFWTQMVGAGVAIIPLFITPILMKVSGGLLNRWVGLVNDPTKGPIDGMRNSLANRGKLMKAGRAERTAGWVGGTRGSRVFGGANSWRRRAATSLTNYGSNNRDKTMKDNLAAAENSMESMYLGTPGGTTARNAVTNSKIEVQNAQLNADTVRLQTGSEGFGLEHETMLRERRKQSAENEAKAAAETTMVGSRINQDLKESEVRKHTAELQSQTASTGAIPHALEAAAKQAEIDKKTADDTSETGALTTLTGTAPGQAALARAEDAKNSLTAAEKTASAVGLAGANRATAASVENATLGAKAAEDDLAREVAPLVSQTARVMAKGAEITKQTAVTEEETRATNSFNSSVEGLDALGNAEDAENRKQTADNDSKSLGIAMANEEFKIQAQTSSEVLDASKQQDKRLYEEVVAGATPAGINAVTAANARTTREMTAVTREATDSAKRVSDDALSERVIADPALAAEMGGIDPNGTLRSRTRAAASLSKSHNETVQNHLALIQRERVSGNTSLTRTQNPALLIEEAEANTINVVKNGSDTDIENLLDYAGALDVTIPAENERKIAILEQYAANIGSRNSPAIGQQALEEIRNGTWNGSMADSWVSRTRGGAFNGIKAAGMSTDQLDNQRSALNAALRDPAQRTPQLMAGLTAYANSIRNYRGDTRIKQPETRIAKRMDQIVRLVDPSYRPTQLP